MFYSGLKIFYFLVRLHVECFYSTKLEQCNNNNIKNNNKKLFLYILSTDWEVILCVLQALEIYKQLLNFLVQCVYFFNEIFIDIPEFYTGKCYYTFVVFQWSDRILEVNVVGN